MLINNCFDKWINGIVFEITIDLILKNTINLTSAASHYDIRFNVFVDTSAIFYGYISHRMQFYNEWNKVGVTAPYKKLFILYFFRLATAKMQSEIFSKSVVVLVIFPILHVAISLVIIVDVGDIYLCWNWMPHNSYLPISQHCHQPFFKSREKLTISWIKIP